MARNPIPTYRRHPKKDRAVVDLYDAAGRRTQRLLPGAFGSDESQAAYQRLISQLQANAGKLPVARGQELPGDLTVAEVVLKFLTEKVVVDYVDAEGKPTTEQDSYRQAVKPLVRLFGDTIAREFDGASLEKVRDAMVNGSWMYEAERRNLEKLKKPTNWCRGNVNKSISRLRSLFRWAVLKKMVPASVVVDLQCLPPLKKGRGGARDTEPVLPVDVDVVEATIPHLPPIVADMVRVQLLTGCRPGELCAMRGADVDRTGTIWLYEPTNHKTAHRGHLRTIAIGPKAQLILRRYWGADEMTDTPSA